MRPGQPIKRTAALKTDPANARGWQQRSRDRALERQRDRPQAKMRVALRRTKPKRKAVVPTEIREAVMRRSGYVCVRPGCDERAVHLHHVLDEEHWPELAKVEANLVGTCPACNWNHHFAPGGKLPVAALPGCALRLVAKLGPRAQIDIARHYVPEPGGTGDNDGGLHG